MAKASLRACLGSAACLLFLAACQTARMALPGFLDERADALVCEGRQGFQRGERFTFGEYSVERVQRGWVRRIAWDMPVAEGLAARQEFEYQVRSPAGALWQGHAVTAVERHEIRGQSGRGEWRWDLASDVDYLVRFADQEQSRFWMLTLSEGPRDTVMSGELTDGDTVYRVEGTYQLAGTPMPLSKPAGFLIYDGPRAVAAVEVINQGTVFLDRGLPAERRDVMAMAAVALLLYRDLPDRR